MAEKEREKGLQDRQTPLPQSAPVLGGPDTAERDTPTREDEAEDAEGRTRSTMRSRSS